MVFASLLILSLAVFDASFYWFESLKSGGLMDWVIGVFLAYGVVKSLFIAGAHRYVFRNCTRHELYASAVAAIVFALVFRYLGTYPLSVALVMVADLSMVCSRAFALPKKPPGF
jgi:hypothetical protein